MSPACRIASGLRAASSSVVFGCGAECVSETTPIRRARSGNLSVLVTNRATRRLTMSFVETLDELEATLRARWDRETLAVYGDHLMSAGDPRGELVALDLRIDDEGATAEL